MYIQHVHTFRHIIHHTDTFLYSSWMHFCEAHYSQLSDWSRSPLDENNLLYLHSSKSCTVKEICLQEWLETCCSSNIWMSGLSSLWRAKAHQGFRLLLSSQHIKELQEHTCWTDIWQGHKVYPNPKFVVCFSVWLAHRWKTLMLGSSTLSTSSFITLWYLRSVDINKPLCTAEIIEYATIINRQISIMTERIFLMGEGWILLGDQIMYWWCLIIFFPPVRLCQM